MGLKSYPHNSSIFLLSFTGLASFHRKLVSLVKLFTKKRFDVSGLSSFFVQTYLLNPTTSKQMNGDHSPLILQSTIIYHDKKVRLDLEVPHVDTRGHHTEAKSDGCSSKLRRYCWVHMLLIT